MLQFILGAAKSGKTTYTRKLLHTNNPTLLIVPEQFTLYTEKKLGMSKNVIITSLSRLATELLKRYGGIAVDYATDSVKLVTMELAIRQLSDTLIVYAKSQKYASFCVTMVDTVTELKHANITPNELLQTSLGIENSYFAAKLKEIAEIYNVYNALLENKYADRQDDIGRAIDVSKGKGTFNGYTIIIDEFKGFTATELELIRILMSEATDMFITLCIKQGDDIIFSEIKSTYNSIRRIAGEQSVIVNVPIYMDRNNYATEWLYELSLSLFEPLKLDCKDVEPFIYSCQNEYDEVTCAVSLIGSLVRNGYRYRDIVIITRNLQLYGHKLIAEFARYNIPYFMDSTKNISNSPLVRFTKMLLSANLVSTDVVIGLLKCGFFSFEQEDIALFENYCFVWNIHSNELVEPFINNPRGFKQSFTNDDAEQLQRINNLREFIIPPLVEFKAQIKDCTAIELSRYLYNQLTNLVADTLEKIMAELYADNQFELAEEYSTIWEQIVECIDTIAAVVGDKMITPKRYLELFSLILAQTQVGVIPQSLDCIVVGSAERMRADNPKAVIIVGANEGEFPLAVSGNGVLTDLEREQLLALDLQLSKPIKNRLIEERFIAYKAVTLPTTQLYITYSGATVYGEVKLPSELVTNICELLSIEPIVYDISVATVFSRDVAFSYLSGHYFDNTEFTLSIKEALKKYPQYNEKVNQLERVFDLDEAMIFNKNNAKQLFTEKLQLSPTRVESFYQCRFKYFCEHALRVRPMQKAQLDPLVTGSLIHQVLSTITTKLDITAKYSPKLCREVIREEMNLYIDEVMGGVENKTARFLYLFQQIENSILKVVKQLFEQAKHSLFVPEDMEYEIQEYAEITPLILKSQNDCNIRVAGKIDRIDVYRAANGKKYIRIIDYKSSKKSIALSDVYYGLNLQMLIYLLCAKQNGSGKYQDVIPAGALYMPLSEPTPSLEKNATEDDMIASINDNYRMDGLIIDDLESVRAMDIDLNGTFIPVTITNSGEFNKRTAGTLIKLKQLAYIEKHIKNLIVDMADMLYDGKIGANPIEGSCDYCSYKAVCHTAFQCKKKLISKKDDVLNILEENYKE